MSGRKCISTLVTPSPWQASQRPPLTLNEKRPGVVAALARLGHAGEELADRREQAGVGRRIGARRAPDRALVDADHLVDVLEAGERRVRRRLGRGAVQVRATAAYSVSLTASTCPSPRRR